MEIYIYQLQTRIGRLEMSAQPTEQESHELRNATDRTSLTDDDGKSEGSRLSSDFDRKGEIETLPDYRSSQSLLQVSHSFSSSYNVTSYNPETSINNSHVHTYSPQQDISPETLSSNPQRSSSFYDDCLKVDNNVMSLKRERDEIETQICDMKIQLTRLQTEVTNLESRKTILETTNQKYMYAADELRAGSVNGHEDSVHTDLDYNLTRAIAEVTIQFYSPLLKKEKNTRLSSARNIKYVFQMEYTHFKNIVFFRLGLNILRLGQHGGIHSVLLHLSSVRNSTLFF